jgi:hypothetical protein
MAAVNADEDGPARADGPAPDPVRARREQVARGALLASRIGYLLFGVAVALFVIAFLVGFSGPVAVAIIAAMVAGSLLLAPAIVIGYAAKAAEKEDRARGW